MLQNKKSFRLKKIEEILLLAREDRAALASNKKSPHLILDKNSLRASLQFNET